jgi:hypothetical protein
MKNIPSVEPMASPNPATTDWVPIWDLHTMSGALPSGGTTGQGLIKNSAANYDASWTTLSSAIFSVAAAMSPAGTTSTTGVMMGLGSTCKITPTRSGLVMLLMFGSLMNSLAGGATQALLFWGTGTAPANGAASTGSGASTTVTAHAAAANYQSPFSIFGLLTGMTLGTQIWFDLRLNSTAASTATAVGCWGVAYELP